MADRLPLDGTDSLTEAAVRNPDEPAGWPEFQPEANCSQPSYVMESGQDFMTESNAELPSADTSAFLRQYRHAYGYGGYQTEGLRLAEFPQLNGAVYVDHAGSTLYAASQLQNVFQASRYSF